MTPLIARLATGAITLALVTLPMQGIYTQARTIPAGSITGAELAASVAGAGLTGGGGSALAVNTDNSTVEVNADIVRVKSAGIGATQLASAAVTKTKLAGGFLKAVTISGGIAGNLTVSGIAVGDEIVAVIPLDLLSGLLGNLLGEFTITGAGTINNTGGTSTAGKTLLVIYLDLT